VRWRSGAIASAIGNHCREQFDHHRGNRETRRKNYPPRAAQQRGAGPLDPGLLTCRNYPNATLADPSDKGEDGQGCTGISGIWGVGSHTRGEENQSKAFPHFPFASGIVPPLIRAGKPRL